MLVAPSQFEELFDGALLEDLASSEDKKLLVFVSTGEADSVCATRILQVRISVQDILNACYTAALPLTPSVFGHDIAAPAHLSDTHEHTLHGTHRCSARPQCRLE